MFQQPERGGEEGESGSDEESEIDAQDGRPGGEEQLKMAALNISMIVGNGMGISVSISMSLAVIRWPLD